MYPINRRLTTVVERLRVLANAETPHDLGCYEAFVASYCVTEKLVRRVLIDRMSELRVTPKQIEEVTHGGYRRIRSRWPRYFSQQLVDVIGAEAETLLSKATEVRDKLCHGEANPGKRKCSKLTTKLIEEIPVLAKKFSTAYGFSGWKHKQGRGRQD